MNLQFLLNTMQRRAAMLLPKLSTLSNGQSSIINRNFHLIQNITTKLTTTIGNECNKNNALTNLLQPTQNYLLTQVCGMKKKTAIYKRCKDCYFICCKGVWQVRCKTHPRHKAFKRVKAERNTWILTSVCQSKKRPWW